MSLTPMVEQYMAVKKQHPDELLFFRLGDFYEMFNEDALVASRELNLTLTKRSNSNGDMPMCGVPYHAVDGYLAKLVKKGYRIAICEQTEDPKEAQGNIVQRDVIRIVTPGTALNEEVLNEGQHRYLVYLLEEGERICLSAADVSTGEFLATCLSGENLLDQVVAELGRFSPAGTCSFQNGDCLTGQGYLKRELDTGHRKNHNCFLPANRVFPYRKAAG